jgi:N-acetylglucosaminyldiphosphoundecaprenol N-acetyl-beta-D-mannosaminyltransferase
MKDIIFDNITYKTGRYDDFINILFKHITEVKNYKLILVHINLRNYYYMNKDSGLKNFIKDNCFVIFEGIGLKAAFFLKGYGMISDLNGTDSFPRFMEKLSTDGEKIFLLGSSKQNIELSTKIIGEKYPLIEVSGFRDGYFTIEEENNIVNIINNSGARILFIGRGFPLQEEFIMRNKELLKVNLIWNVGGLFDILSGNKRRAPATFRKLRLEWLYRMVKEPRRMVHRNSIAAIWSITHILFSKRA